MRVRNSDLLAGALVSVLVVLLAVPVLIIGGDTVEIRLAPWFALYALMVVSMMTSMWLGELLPRRLQVVGLAAMVLSTGGVVATSPRLGYAAIAAVVSVAICAYYLPRPWVRGVALLNTAVIVGSQAAIGSPTMALLFAGVVYLVLQLVTVMSIDSQLSEQRALDDLQSANADLRATRALLQESSRSEERLRIARELHDVVGHQLTGLILELEIASHQATGEARAHVVKARGIARDLMADVRTTVDAERELAPDLRAALQHVTSDLPGLNVHLHVDDAVHPRPDALTALVRATQEVVTNTLRHASADQLWITVTSGEDGIRFAAHDDGVGSTVHVPGNGLRGMAERLDALDGTLVLDGGPGFPVRASIPAGGLA